MWVPEYFFDLEFHWKIIEIPPHPQPKGIWKIWVNEQKVFCDHNLFTLYVLCNVHSKYPIWLRHWRTYIIFFVHIMLLHITHLLIPAINISRRLHIRTNLNQLGRHLLYRFCRRKLSEIILTIIFIWLKLQSFKRWSLPLNFTWCYDCSRRFQLKLAWI